MLQNALVVYLCELMIDTIKHSFIAKFNEIKPIVYSEFLEDLCKQVTLVTLLYDFHTLYECTDFYLMISRQVSLHAQIYSICLIRKYMLIDDLYNIGLK